MFNKSNWKVLALSIVLAGALIGLGLQSAGVTAAGPGDPDPGTVVGVSGPLTLYSTPLTGTNTAYSSRSISAYNYNSFDWFVTADVSGTASVTVTVQTSADNANWADATYTYLADSATYTTTTSIITSTGTITATSVTTNVVSTSEQENTYQIVLSSDTTDYIRVPMIGYYIRAKIVSSGTITPVVRLVGWNNGG